MENQNGVAESGAFYLLCTITYLMRRKYLQMQNYLYTEKCSGKCSCNRRQQVLEVEALQLP